jgi:hypothetical protein
VLADRTHIIDVWRGGRCYKGAAYSR